jgi:hypothetical protein
MDKIDVTIDALIRAKATREESERAIREVCLCHSEPRQWESADISYDEETG